MTPQEFNQAKTNREKWQTLTSLRDNLPDLAPGVDPTPQDLQTAGLVYSLLTTQARRQFIQASKAAANAEIVALNTEFAAL